MGLNLPDGTATLSTMFLLVIVICVAYLLGSIPFGFLLVLLVRKQDIRAQGSGKHRR